MASYQYHVVPHDDGWAVKRSDAERASSVHETKEEAMEAGRELAMKHETELLIHNKDGKISERNSYGNDPHPPKG